MRPGSSQYFAPATRSWLKFRGKRGCHVISVYRWGQDIFHGKEGVDGKRTSGQF